MISYFWNKLYKLLKILKIYPDFLSMGIIKKNGKIHFRFYDGFESRLPNTKKMILDADKIFDIPNFKREILISVDDLCQKSSWGKKKIIQVATCDSNFDNCIPDFLFISWPETGIDNFKNLITNSLKIKNPQNGVLGWRGASTHPIRDKLIDLNSDKPNTDIKLIEWSKSNLKSLRPPEFLSIEEQLKRWQFFIDVEGRGYSARLKIYLSCERLVFIQERKMKEFYFEYLVPFKHYIPVKEDLSDLHEKLKFVILNPIIEKQICSNLKDFREKYFEYDKILERWYKVISNSIN